MSISGKTFWLLSAIVLLGAAARFSGLESLPPSLNWDEVSHGYNAYSLFKTGGDEWGVTLPAIFRAFGDYKLPVYIYATVLSEVLFGLTATGVRFFSVITYTGRNHNSFFSFSISLIIMVLFFELTSFLFTSFFHSRLVVSRDNPASEAISLWVNIS